MFPYNAIRELGLTPPVPPLLGGAVAVPGWGLHMLDYSFIA